MLENSKHIPRFSNNFKRHIRSSSKHGVTTVLRWERREKAIVRSASVDRKLPSISKSGFPWRKEGIICQRII
ncbi:hypothetical protein Ancab_026934 [Ancistrocladus abbreviatus]